MLWTLSSDHMESGQQDPGRSGAPQQRVVAQAGRSSSCPTADAVSNWAAVGRDGPSFSSTGGRSCTGTTEQQGVTQQRCESSSRSSSSRHPAFVRRRAHIQLHQTVQQQSGTLSWRQDAAPHQQQLWALESPPRYQCLDLQQRQQQQERKQQQQQQQQPCHPPAGRVAGVRRPLCLASCSLSSGSLWPSSSSRGGLGLVDSSSSSRTGEAAAMCAASSSTDGDGDSSRRRTQPLADLAAAAAAAASAAPSTYTPLLTLPKLEWPPAPLAVPPALVQLWDSLSHVKLLVAGASSALVSRTAVAPLERVKMEQVLKTSSRSALQTALWVYQHEGVAGFWKGNALNVLRTAPFKALNFFSFDMYSKAFANMFGAECQSAKFAAGACAGITATLVCFPLDVLRTRIMAPSGAKYGGPLATLRGIVRHEGAAALYAGCVPAVIGMAPAGAVFYGVYDLLKAAHFKEAAAEHAAAAASSGAAAVAAAAAADQHQELPAAYTLLYGALAGASAEVMVYPLEVIRRKMQLLSMSSAAASAASNSSGGPILRGLKAHRLPPPIAAAAAASGSAAAAAGGSPAASGRILAACSAILQAGGPPGFYRGLLPNMLQVLPSASLSYFTYETVKHALGVCG